VSARGLLAELRAELAPVEQAIRRHRYLGADLPDGALRAFAGEQHTILGSDRRSFAYLAARFPEPPVGDFFLGLPEPVSPWRLRALGQRALLSNCARS
jgi:hypothetical protein